MAWSPQWPAGLDSYGSFPGQPFTDGSEYILAAYADSWVLAIANLEAYIGYGSGAQDPVYSPVFGQNFGTIAARLVNVETVANTASQATAAVIPVGGIIEWANDSEPPENYLYLHGQTVTNGATIYPTLASVYPGWVSGNNLIMPDTRNRVTIGAGSTYSSGQTAGSANVTLAADNIPALTASLNISDPGHYHTPGEGPTFVEGSTTAINWFLSSSEGSAGSYVVNNQETTSTSTTGISGSVTVGTGSPDAISTLQPSIAFHKVVRAA